MNQLLDYLAKIHQPYLHAKGEVATNYLIKWLDCQPGEKVLEFGVGTGGTLIKLAACYKQTDIWGVDASEIMINKASQRLSFCLLKNRVILKKIEHNDYNQFADNYFDKIYVESVLGIQSAETLSNLIVFFNRILKPSGKLILNETIWLESTTLKTANAFNILTKDRYGIIQANTDYPYLTDWLSLLSQNQFSTLKIEEVDRLSPIKIRRTKNELLSILFTRLGTIYGKIFLRLAMQEFAKPLVPDQLGQQLMEGYLIKVENRKSPI